MTNRQLGFTKPACRKTGLLMVMLVYSTSVSGQVDIHFNKFQEFSGGKNIDSAFYHARALASINEGFLNQLVHNAFAQKFRKAASHTDTAFASRLLRKLYTDTTNLPLKRAVYPLYWYVEIGNELANPAKVRPYVAGFMRAHAKVPEEPGNRIDRYALLLYRQLKQKPEYASLADTLFERTRNRLQHAVNGRYFQAVDDQTIREGRAYFRYLMALSNHLKAEEAVAKRDSVNAEAFRKAASAFSPDENDRLAKSAYFYESVFLFNGEDRENFHQPYVDLLVAKGANTAALQVLTELAFADPGTIDLLKKQYAKMPVSGQSFTDYWTKTLNASLKPTESFRLVSIDNQIIDYEKYKGKWVLIDFWGTWCKPCVAELPVFQKFYNELASTNPQDIVVFTVACHETGEAPVAAFLKKFDYTFPVVMGNEQLIKQFRVGGYPTKILITPEGKRMQIPFGTAWTERVKTYLANYKAPN